MKMILKRENEGKNTKIKNVVWLKESCALHENHKLGSRIYCSEAIKSPKVFGAVRVRRETIFQNIYKIFFMQI